MIKKSQDNSVKQVSQYTRYCELMELNKTSKEIIKLLSIPHWKVKEYKDYYSDRTKRLTFNKYKILRKRFKDEQIRKHYKIPICEFNLFLEGIKNLRKI
ncbi:hypothetical protein [Niallia sp. FSL R7-0271]|uniref:hypothetical protein n=1 Tax=Niallia sp. FSL R7-0271 TaxID=2921678 RepID=UPI0030F567CA